MSTERNLDVVAARESIKELRTFYARYIDNAEWNSWANLFTEGATADFGGFENLEGRSEIEEFGRDVISDIYEYSKHQALMPDINVNGDEASGTWNLVVFYEMPDGTKGEVTGTYIDEYRRIDGTWKFSHVENVLENDSGEGEPHF
jgi:3-phenylpropionate/cinnamic acid dioxygenase small subunit